MRDRFNQRSHRQQQCCSIVVVVVLTIIDRQQSSDNSGRKSFIAALTRRWIGEKKVAVCETGPELYTAAQRVCLWCPGQAGALVVFLFVFLAQ